MGEVSDVMNQNHHLNQVYSVAIDIRQGGASDLLDDDGRPKRTGNLWTASAHIITAVIGSGVLSLAWAIAQLGWIAGPLVMLLFSMVTYYTSILLASCYRSGDPVTGKRNYTYMEAVQSNLGGSMVKVCGYVQYFNLFGVSIGYTIAASISMMAINRSDCFHKKGKNSSCHAKATPYMVAFGIVEVILSQIPDIDQLWWLSILASIMSFTYSSIGLGLGIAKVVEIKKIRGSLTGISVGVVTKTQKTWRSFQALGDIAFAYSYSMILLEIQDTIRSPPSEKKTMTKATMLSVAVTTIFYLFCGCFGYAAFGDLSPDNLLTGFGFYNPFWLIDIANAAIAIHLLGAYQVYSQPLFAFVEKSVSKKFPNTHFTTKEFRLPGCRSYHLSLRRLAARSAYVVITTVIAMILPFFNGVVGLLGALGFWPLTVYFPVEMYLSQNKIPRWSRKWVFLQILSLSCLAITVVAAAGSVAGLIGDLRHVKPFKSTY